MITLLTGENSFEIAHTLNRLKAEFAGEAESFDGADMTLAQLPDLLLGMSLFSEARLVIVRQLSENTALWSVLPDWLERMSDDVHLVLIEPKPDKRTKTWKSLQKMATVQTFAPWSERDVSKAERWVQEQAQARTMTLPRSVGSLLVARVGVDQWQLWQALETLSVYEEVTEDIIRTSIDATPLENVFELFETALTGKQARLQEMSSTLSLSEDPYRLFGLLSGQAFQLAALAAAPANEDVGRDLGVHPYALSRLRPHAQRLGVRGAGEIVEVFAAADERMKTSAVTPWLAIEQALLQVASKQ